MSTAAGLLARIGIPFARFRPPLQDSGYVVWGVDADGIGIERLLPGSGSGSGSGDAMRMFMNKETL